jgi:hypothetical protein
MSARITVDKSLIEFAIWALRKSNYLECADALAAALSTEPGEAEGMVLVPREPNADQLRQLFSMNSALPRTTEEAIAVYHAILNCAAPLPEDTREDKP